MVTNDASASSSKTVTGAAKTKSKKDEQANKKPTGLNQAKLKNDELSKWGVKALSNLKPSVDGQ